jgi:hypothetical protein
MHDWSDQKNAVLVDNTAQAVFKHLDRIRDNRVLLGTRWIWELLQNARDVASVAGVIVRIELTDSYLAFRHNGKPFDVQDVIHLIYHGSTKVDLSGAVGRYGSGFISTHLLSPVVRLRGELSEGTRFDFLIDRSGTNVHALSEDMERSWRAFNESVRSGAGPSEFTAEFEYPLDESARELVTTGLSQLKACASLVLAFSPEIAQIEVRTPLTRWNISRSSSTRVYHDVSLLKVNYQDETSPGSRWVAVSNRQNAAVALPLIDEQGELRVALTPAVPRLYVLFPMVTTERLTLPVAISSLSFKPREDRDGIVLQGEAEGPAGNRRIVEESADDIRALLQCAANYGWRGIESVVSFDASNPPDWLEPGWYRRLLLHLVEIARGTPLVVLESGERLAPQDACIPYGEDDGECLAIASHGAGLSEVAARLPRTDLIPAWSRNVLHWAQLRGSSPEDLPEVLTLPRIAQRAAAARTLNELQGSLNRQVSSVAWLANLIQHLRRNDFGSLLDHLALLPAQDGTFRRRSELKRDIGIDDEMKEIAAALGFDLRPTLLDLRIGADVVADFLPPISEDEAVTQAIQHLHDRCGDGRMPRDMVAPSVALFAWIAARSKYEHHLRGFPIPTADQDDDSATVIELSRHPQLDERPIAPPERWPEALQPFAPLFPRRRILNEAFRDSQLETDSWDRLERHGLMMLGPVYRIDGEASLFKPDEFITVENADAHQSTEPVSLTQIAYLSGDDFMVLDTIRKSSTRAADFLRFLTKLAEDSQFNPSESISVACICGPTHNAYCAGWLHAVRSRSWVPTGSDGKRASKLTAESLAELAGRHADLVHNLGQEHGNALLTALEISPADFMLRMVAQEEHARVELIRSMSDLRHAAGGDLDRVRELVREISEHPEILIQIEHQREQRERVSRNQHIGRLVEELLQEALTSEDLRVRRTGVGSDYEVDSDLVDEQEEILLELTKAGSATLIEIKSTRTDGAKMTPRQADTARNSGLNFALCVVEIADDEPTIDLVRERCRFVFDIGARLGSAWTQYETIQCATTAAQGSAGPISIEVIEGQYRFMIRREIWQAGLTFQEAVARFRG